MHTKMIFRLPIITSPLGDLCNRMGENHSGLKLLCIEAGTFRETHKIFQEYGLKLRKL